MRLGLRLALAFAAICFLMAVCAGGLRAQTTLNLSDCSQSSLQTEWNAMSSGAYVLVFPSCAAGGTGTWTTALSLSAPPTAVTSVKLEGQNSMNCTGTPGTSGYVCTATDATVIEDNYNSNAAVLVVNLGSQGIAFRITDITLQPGSSGAAKSNGIVDFFGNTTSFRWDDSHIVVTDADGDGPEFDGQIEGVFDHNQFQCGESTSFTNCVRIYTDLLDSVGNGDGGWMAATQWGSQHAMFLESNYVTGGYFTDCDHAARVVIRYNTFASVQDANGAIHSTKFTYRGCRTEEFYGNYESGPAGGFALTGGEGSSLLEWGNTLGNLAFSWFYSGGLYRNGAGNDISMPSPPNGWGWCGITISAEFDGGVISSWDGNSNTASGYPCLDGLGRGQQQQGMNGASFPTRANTSTGGQNWPQQYLEPIYLFDNTLPSGMGGEARTSDESTQFNRDVYFDCGPYNSACSSGFTGEAGTGYGLLSARPSTCTAGPGGTFGTSPTGSYGVAYWATDANSGNGELYVCTSPNTWTALYTPYTYPHPLVSGGGGGSVTISPSSQNFGAVNVGSSSGNVTFTVTNGSSASMTSVTVSITGTNASYFTSTGGGTCGSTLASMASCTVIVNFSPAAAGTNFTATLRISYSGGDGSSPVSVGLSGTGISSCTSPVSVNAYTICSSAFAEASSPNTVVSLPFTPYGGNGVEVFVEWCVVGCNADATQTVTVSDNINSPETCFVDAPHSPYQVANTSVPDYPIVHAYYCPNFPSGVTQLTATVSGSVDFLSINAQEIKAGQIASTGYFESVDQTQNSGNTANTTASVSTSGATANAADLITALVVNCGGSIAATPGTGYTGITVNPSADPGWVLEDMGVAATGAQTAITTWSSGTASGTCALGASAPNTTWWGAIVPLKGASGSPSLNPPAISPSAGAYSNPTTVTITGPAGAVICYTTNGTAPSASTPGTCDAGSTAYSSSFSLTIPSGGATVEALATESGYTNSAITSVSYSLVACANTSLGGGWSCVTSAGNSTGTSSSSLSLGPFPTNPPAGALILVTGFNGSNAGCAAPSDSLVSIWHLIVSPTVSADSLQLCAYWGVTTSAGADTVTWNSATTAASMGGAATVYTTPSGTLSVDKTCSNSNATSGTGSNNAACLSGYTNSGSNELNAFVSYGDYSATVTAAANYTLVNAPAFLRDEYYMQPAATAITPAETISSSLNYGAMGASFEIATGSAPPLPPTALIATPF